MIVGPAIMAEEKDILVKMLHNWKEAIVFLFEEICMIKPDVAPPQEIRTIPHKI